MLAESDRARVSPGSRLLGQLLERYAPALLLIDEWVAFVRQLYANNELPAGTFDSNMTFVQALTEAVKATPGALLVASLPASQIEIGGEGGEVALDRLKNTFGRIESSWRPATPKASRSCAGGCSSLSEQRGAGVSCRPHKGDGRPRGGQAQ